MNASDKLNLSIPIIFVNPYFNVSFDLIANVYRFGAIGVIDHVTAGPSRISPDGKTPYGVRCRMSDPMLRAGNDIVRLAIIPVEDSVALADSADGELSRLPFPVMVEVANIEDTRHAERAGACGVIAKGAECGGWTSKTHGFVLLQQILQSSGLPVFLQGGVGPYATAGAMRAGSSGIVIDYHLLLTTESALDEDLKKFLGDLDMPASACLNNVSGHPFRAYSRIGTKKVRELKKNEESIPGEEFDKYKNIITESIGYPSSKPDLDDSIFPFSEDLVINSELFKKKRTTLEVISSFVDAMRPSAVEWPFSEGSTLCFEHGSKYPFVQGPMAHVSDNSDFLKAVSEAGALPFLALGNMPGSIAREAMDQTRQEIGQTFGVGLIGLEVNRSRYEEHLEIMRGNPPKFAILAASGPDLALTIEKMGTSCYLHCPSPGVLGEALKSGLRRFVFEGGESGGHIANLTSLNLWNANLNYLEKAHQEGLDLKDVRVLFAGGIGSPTGVAFIAGMAAQLVEKGLKIGLQMGTSYLTTREAVRCKAITECYQRLTLEASDTVVIGRTVNTMARAACSKMARTLIDRELERLRAGIALNERKELYERDNLGALRLASKGCAIDPETAQSECPRFSELSPDEQVERGLYLLGQAACLFSEPTTIERLHSDLIFGGLAVYRETSGGLDSAQPAGSLESKHPGGEVQTDSEGPDSMSGNWDLNEPLEFLTQGLEFDSDREPIAVVGIGLQVPGSDTVEKFWRQIMDRRSGIVSAPVERWGDIDMYYHPDPKIPDKTYSKIGGFITDFEFDPLKYRIPPTVAQKMDRTQKMAVACVADALTDAGLTPEDLKGKKVGIVIGNSMGGETTDLYAERIGFPKTMSKMREALTAADVDKTTIEKVAEDFRYRFMKGLPEITEDSLPGELANVISGRVANVFNLEGPNFTVDAACASSMAAIMNAVSGLRSRSMDYAIAGGVDASMQPSSFVKFSKIGALSADGSRPFDESANGFVMGEGAGIILMKRLSDAVSNGDRIYAVILDVGSSSDGRGKGITAPNAAGQERAIRASMERSGIAPSTIGLVEAHGTSTAVGDKTELMMLDSFFRKEGAQLGSVGIGSVKSQIGHLKAASGAAGIIKAILSLHHRTLPPTANIQQPNPCIDWKSSPLTLLKEAKPWSAVNGMPRRAGVSAFGFGGTNFHVVLQEYSPQLRLVSSNKISPTSIVKFVPPDWPKPEKFDTKGSVWVLGADNLEDLTNKIATILKTATPLNHTNLAQAHRNECLKFNMRVGFASPDVETTSKKMESILEALPDRSKIGFLVARGVYFSEGKPKRNTPGAAFIFPGQGSQYPYMLRDLCERFPIVAETFLEADEIMNGLGQGEITSLVFPEASSIGESGSSDALKDTQVLQPMILTADTAIFRLLRRVGLKPVACAGHSLGEYAACVASGVFSFRHALEAVAVRGREMARVSLADPGLMMSIPADARLVEEVISRIDGYVVAANKNSPKQTVISGETAAVIKAGEVFKERGLEGVILPVSAAFHSGVVAPAREPFMKTLEKLEVSSPEIAIVSNVTGDYYPVGPGAPSRIRDLLGKQFAAPVEWVKTLRRLHSDGIRVFLECGPKRVMTNLTIDTLTKDTLALPTNHPKKGGITQLLESFAALIVEGFEIDIDAAEIPSLSGEVPSKRKKSSLTLVSKGHDSIQRLGYETKLEHDPPSSLDWLLDEELKEIVSRKEFKKFVELQVNPIRTLIKSSFSSFVENILPLEKTVTMVKTEGMNFKPVVISGMAAGLPSDTRFVFDKANLDDLIYGKNFIKRVPENSRREMLEKNVERLFKGPSGEVELQHVDDMSGVIKLAGFFDDQDSFIEEFGLEKRLTEAMDVTTRLAVAAGLEALKDAGIPLMRQIKTTSSGIELPDAWALPPDLRDETGIIFASAFPGMASLVDEVTREASARFGAGAKKRLIDFYTGIVQRIRDDKEKELLTKWFTEEFDGLSLSSSSELYSFNRNFLLRVMSMGHGQLAQIIKAQGPNTHVDAACAGTTQAILLGRDWIRTGQAKRVLVVAADDVAGKQLFPWIGSGFLAMGAATTNGAITDAALPFDDRRHGLILGSAAAAVVLESEDLARRRGIEPLASIEAGIVANSGFHGTRLDVDHISFVMEKMISKWERQSDVSRHDLAKKMFFMSHETYSPKRGGSSSSEVRALRSIFGESAKIIPIANTKGFTGHTMGVGVEDIVALRCLQKKFLPPIPNLKVPDPEFQDMNLSAGGPCEAQYALRLAAGFGSQIVMSLYKGIAREENRVTDFGANREWLKEITNFKDPVITIENRIMRVKDRELIEKPGFDKVKLVDPAQEQPKWVAVAPSMTGIQEIKNAILQLLSEKTGYPPSMLDTGLDLEADLGIDTVKQAEFISDVRDKFNIPRIEGLKIAEFPTIEHIINFVMEHSVSEITEANDHSGGGAAQDVVTSSDRLEVNSRILDLLSAKTGYPTEMLDVDLDLEADLGIDTVKQAEFITEIRETFRIPRIDGLKIADFPTIKHIIGFVLEKKAQSSNVVNVTEKPVHSTDVVVDSAPVDLREAVLTTFDTEKTSMIPSIDELIIFGGHTGLVDGFQKVMGPVPVTALEDPKEIGTRRDKLLGVINISTRSNIQTSLDRSFELFLELAATYEDGPVFMTNIVSEDGAFGFEGPDPAGYLFGAISGAAKSFSREYPRTICRCVDIHPEAMDEHAPGIFLRCLTEDFPLETGVGKNLQLQCVRFSKPLPRMDTSTAIASDEVVLVTGGARGITAACVNRIAEQVPATFVILGRSSLSNRAETMSTFGDIEWELEKDRIIDRYKRESTIPTPVLVEKELAELRNQVEVFKNLRKFRSLGSEVIYRSVDITNPSAVDKVIEEVARLCRRVDVFVHGAGIDISKSLRSKTIEQIRSVFDVKVEGARNVLQALEKNELPPRRLISFGSVAGRFGNIAQIDYSAANDSIAHLFRWINSNGGDIRASVIDWAPWAEIGMATRESVQKTLEQAGIDFIPPHKGVDAFLQELARSLGSAEVLVSGRLGPFEKDAFSTPSRQSCEAYILAGQKVTVEKLIPCEKATFRIDLDPGHPLLNDHRIDRAAVLPGVGGIEIMRKAVEILDPESSKLVIQNVHFLKPLKIFKSEKFTAEITVERISTGLNKFRARISSRMLDKQGQPFGESRIHHELYLGEAAPFDLPQLDLNSKQTVFVPEKEIYSKFFHGPAFQFVDYVSVENNGSGARFRFRDTERRPEIFPDLIPPVIEAAFQAGAAMALETLGVMPLPVAVGEVVILDPEGLPGCGTLIPSEIVTGESGQGRTKIKFDCAVKTEEGTLLLFLRGVEMIELEKSSSFANRIFEEFSSIDELLDRPEKDDDNLKTFVDIDSETRLAKASPKRRKEWSAGRIVIKKALNRLLSNNGNNHKNGNTINIFSTTLGKPTARFSDNPDEEFAEVALSHSNGFVMASVGKSDAFQGIGVDVEKVENRTQSWSEDYFTETEINMAYDSPNSSRQLTRMWSLKEACLKALGVGLRYDLKDVSVISMNKFGRAEMLFQNEVKKYIQDNGLPEIEARVEDVGDLVVARALIRR